MAAAISPLKADQSSLGSSADEVIQELLKKGSDWELAYHQVENEELQECLVRVQEILSQNLENAYETYRVRNEATFQRQMANLISYRDRKTEEWKKRIATLQSKSGKPGQVKGFEAALQKHLNECQRRITVLKATSRPAKNFREIAIILCKVTNH